MRQETQQALYQCIDRAGAGTATQGDTAAHGDSHQHVPGNYQVAAELRIKLEWALPLPLLGKHY